MTGISVERLCEQLDLEFAGDPQQVVKGVCELRPGKLDHLAFAQISAQAKAVSESKASVLLLPKALASVSQGASEIYADDPYLSFAKISQILTQPDAQPRRGQSAAIHPEAMLDPSASVGEMCSIGAASIANDCVIGHGCHIADDVVLAEGCRLGHNVVIEAGTRLGAHCRVLANTTLGESGFGYANDGRGRWQHIEHSGGLHIGERVHIGANTSIDRGTISPTVIEDDVIIDNQVQIGHNAHIGAGTAIAASAAIAGSAKIGARCLIGGATAIGGHFEICDGVTIAGGSVITAKITQPGTYKSGSPTLPLTQWQRLAVTLRRLINPAAKRGESC